MKLAGCTPCPYAFILPKHPLAQSSAFDRRDFDTTIHQAVSPAKRAVSFADLCAKTRDKQSGAVSRQ